MKTKSKTATRKRKHGKGLSDSTLMKLWRQAVLTTYNNKCVICGSMNNLECHHIVHRKIKVLRFDHRNGVPVCSPLQNNCHHLADMLEGREIVREVIGEGKYIYLRNLEGTLFKDYIRDLGISENNWRDLVKTELLAIINKSAS